MFLTSEIYKMTMSKHVQVGDWIFEMKMVRAIKVDEYGKPYSAIANCNVNGDTLYIDGLLTQEGQNLTREDFQSFNDFCYKMNIDKCSYHRYQNGQSITKIVTVVAPHVENNSKNNKAKIISPFHLVK
jgi:hypothetical protein